MRPDTEETSMKLLYFIQTFKGLPQITRLVATIKRSTPNAAILISHNRESFSIDPAVFGGLPDVHVMHVTGINRVDFSLMQAYFDGIERARELGIDFDWVVNLSGQCYPTRPLSELEQMLAATSYDGFMDYFPVFSASERSSWDRYEATNRYKFQYRWRLLTRELPPPVRRVVSIPRRIFNNLQPFIRFDTSYALQIGTRIPSHVFRDFTLYGGSYWKTLSRRAVDYLCDFPRRSPELTEYFRHMNIPNEVLPQSVLLNNPELSFSYHDLVYINWHNTKHGRPHTIKVSDYDRIVAGNYFFARKFDPAEDSRVLAMLDARIFAGAATPPQEEAPAPPPASPALS
jgi:hypothetical protein